MGFVKCCCCCCCIAMLRGVMRSMASFQEEGQVCWTTDNECRWSVKESLMTRQSLRNKLAFACFFTLQVTPAYQQASAHTMARVSRKETPNGTAPFRLMPPLDNHDSP